MERRRSRLEPSQNQAGRIISSGMNAGGFSLARLVTGLAWIVSAGVLPAETARIVEKNVSLRDAPDEAGRIVGEVPRGASVRILDRSEDPDWVKVVPPETQDLWIYADLVEDGRVAVKFAQVRAGKGLDYKVVGRVSLDDTVTVRGRSGDWLRIAPPPGAGLWVAARALERVEKVPIAEQDASPLPAASRETPPGEPPRPSPAPDLPTPPFVKPPENTGSSRPLPVSPSVRRDVSAPDGGRKRTSRSGTGDGEVRVRGVVRRSGLVFRRPSEYRLVTYDRKGRAVTLCYLAGNEHRLAGLLGARVSVSGRRVPSFGLAQDLLQVRDLTVDDR